MSSSDPQLDDALVATYAEFGVPADQFFADTQLTQRFLRLLAARLKRTVKDPRRTMRRLVSLRKMGRLPRLQRAYYGRGGRDVTAQANVGA